ncbi:MAG: hypothetical protein PHS37_01040 [Candidatus Omnitrophica bacterium]|nr:hypothetical protein [Candidatus Omnitrophota bacterium]
MKFSMAHVLGLILCVTVVCLGCPAVYAAAPKLPQQAIDALKAFIPTHIAAPTGTEMEKMLKLKNIKQKNKTTWTFQSQVRGYTFSFSWDAATSLKVTSVTCVSRGKTINVQTSGITYLSKILNLKAASLSPGDYYLGTDRSMTLTMNGTGTGAYQMSTVFNPVACKFELAIGPVSRGAHIATMLSALNDNIAKSKTAIQLSRYAYSALPPYFGNAYIEFSVGNYNVRYIENPKQKTYCLYGINLKGSTVDFVDKALIAAGYQNLDVEAYKNAAVKNYTVDKNGNWSLILNDPTGHQATIKVNQNGIATRDTLKDAEAAALDEFKNNTQWSEGGRGVNAKYKLFWSKQEQGPDGAMVNKVVVGFEWAKETVLAASYQSSVSSPGSLKLTVLQDEYMTNLLATSAAFMKAKGITGTQELTAYSVDRNDTADPDWGTGSYKLEYTNSDNSATQTVHFSYSFTAWNQGQKEPPVYCKLGNGNYEQVTAIKAPNITNPAAQLVNNFKAAEPVKKEVIGDPSVAGKIFATQISQDKSPFQSPEAPVTGTQALDKPQQ